MRRSSLIGGLLLAAASVSCMPRLTPLTGEPIPASRLPRTTLPPGHRSLIFSWDLQDRDMVGRGDGAARIAAPDSARLDFFLAGGFGGGAAVLIGDSVQAPGGDLIRRLVPPATLLWAALGRVALPSLPDTVIKVDGATIRADIGRPVAFRLTFRGDTLVRAERVTGDKVAEWVERTDRTHIQYRNESSRRSLKLTITRTDEAPQFDASIWHLVP
jgi:hypothetical protein